MFTIIFQMNYSHNYGREKKCTYSFLGDKVVKIGILDKIVEGRWDRGS